MADEINIVVRAEDKASATLGTIAGLLSGGLVIAASLAASAFAALTTAATGAFLLIKSSVEEAAQSEIAIADLEATLRSTSGAAGMTSQELQNLATALQATTRFSDETILKGEAMLLTFTSIGKEIFPQATISMLDLAAKMGTDASQAAIQLGKALNDPIGGVTALRRVGVQFNDEQERQIKLMVESGNLMGAQKLILAELQKEFGGLAVALGDTFLGRIDRLKNQLSDLKELLGGPFIVALSDVLDKILDFIDNSPAIEIFREFFTTLNTLLGQGAPFLSAFAISLDNLGMKFPELESFVGPLVDAFVAMQSVLDTGGTALEAFKVGVDNLAGSNSPLAGLAKNIQDVVTAFDEGGIVAAAATFVANIVTEITNGVNRWVDGDGPGKLSDKIISWIDRIGTDDIGGGVTSKITTAAANLFHALDVAVSKIKWLDIAAAIDKKLADALAQHDWAKSGAEFGKGLTSAFEKSSGQFDPNSDAFWWLDNWPFMITARLIKGLVSSESAAQLKEGINTWLDNAFREIDWNTVLKFTATPVWAILEIFNKAKPAIINWWLVTGKDVWQGFIDGLTSVATDIGKWVQDHIIKPVKQFLGIFSPSTVFFGIGVDIVQGLINGITSMTNPILEGFKILLGKILALPGFQQIANLLGIGSATGGASATFGGFGTTTGTVGGRNMGDLGTVPLSSAASVTNNFYAPVYFGDLSQLGYDCPTPHPLLEASRKSLLTSVTVR